MRRSAARCIAFFVLALAGQSAGRCAEAASGPATPARAKDLMAESVPMVRTWIPGDFPTQVPSDVRSGKALVRIVVDEKGAIGATRVLSASQPAFGDAAVAAVKRWTFSPGVDDGKYAPMCLDVPFEFSRDRPPKAGLLPPDRLMPRLSPRKSAALIDGPVGDCPQTLIGRGLPGSVLFTCLVDGEGKASAPRILRASHADYVLPALASFPSWRFSPSMQGDLARPTELQGEVNYTDTHTPSRAKVLEANGITGPDGKPPEDAPQPVAMADPVWPYASLLKGEGGTASVEFTVGANGVIKDLRVHEASDPAFGASLLAAVRTWSFSPAMSNGRTIDVPLLAHAEFKPPVTDEATEDPLGRLVALARTNAIGGGRSLDEKLTPLYRVAPVVKTSGSEKGSVTVEFVIDRDGRARLPRIVSATREEFGWAAATAVSQWVFKAPTRGGQPTEVKVQIPMEF